MTFNRPLVPENLCPEALEAVCCCCNTGDATDDNDLGICDRCDKAFHAKCHNPPVAYFGSPDAEDQWFCATCTNEIAKLRNIPVAAGDFVWATLASESQYWPARVAKVDFSSLADPKPLWVLFYDTGAKEGAWVSEGQVKPWVQGPAFSDVREAKRRLAVRLAEADGAAPISGTGPQAPVAALPPSRVAQAKRAPEVADRPVKRQRQRRAPTSAPEMDNDAVELSQQMGEMRQLILAARERQQRLERELDEATQAVAPAQE